MSVQARSYVQLIERQQKMLPRAESVRDLGGCGCCLLRTMVHTAQIQCEGLDLPQTYAQQEAYNLELPASPPLQSPSFTNSP